MEKMKMGVYGESSVERLPLLLSCLQGHFSLSNLSLIMRHTGQDFPYVMKFSREVSNLQENKCDEVVINIA